MPRNKDNRFTARSAKKRCKPGGKWRTEEAANQAILRLEKDHPLDALGMRAYRCPDCDLYHVGRAGIRQ